MASIWAIKISIAKAILRFQTHKKQIYRLEEVNFTISPFTVDALESKLLISMIKISMVYPIMNGSWWMVIKISGLLLSTGSCILHSLFKKMII